MLIVAWASQQPVCCLRTDLNPKWLYYFDQDAPRCWLLLIGPPGRGVAPERDRDRQAEVEVEVRVEVGRKAE